MAKNSHRPNGQWHQVSSLYSAALRVILALEIICWEVANPPTSAFAISATLPHIGATSGFLASGWYALGCAAKAVQTVDTGVTVRESHFAVHLFPKNA